MENTKNKSNPLLPSLENIVDEGKRKLTDGAHLVSERATQMLDKMTSDEQNVAQGERVVSGIAGLALAAFAVERFNKNSWIAGTAAALAGGGLIIRSLTGQCSIYKALDRNTFDSTKVKHGKMTLESDAGVKVETSVTIERPAAELFRFWRNLENLPHIMGHLKSVHQITPSSSHWIASGPAGLKVEWDAEIISEKENEVIAWQSVAGSQVANAGSVRFVAMPGGKGTEIKVNLKYDPPFGKVGIAVAKLFGQDAEVEINADLAQFKTAVEAGELTGGEVIDRAEKSAARRAIRGH